MPRISVEARAAAAHRAGSRHPKPPGHLKGRARVLWREIVASKPLDYFDPANQGLLARFCALSSYAEWLEVRLADDPTAALADELRKTSAVTGVLAVRMRLTVQATVDRKSGQLDEKGPGQVLHLIGGQAFRPQDDEA